MNTTLEAEHRILTIRKALTDELWRLLESPVVYLGDVERAAIELALDHCALSDVSRDTHRIGELLDRLVEAAGTHARPLLHVTRLLVIHRLRLVITTINRAGFLDEAVAELDRFRAVELGLDPLTIA